MDKPCATKWGISHVKTAAKEYMIPAMVEAGKLIRTIDKVEVGKDKKLTVQGSAQPDGVVVCCTLTRHGRTDLHPDESFETIWRHTRFVTSTNKKDPNWTVVFEVQHEGTYLVACHSGTKTPNDYVEVVVSKVDKRGDAKDDMRLSMNPPNFSPQLISTTGTVLNPGNTVTVTLTPINCMTGEWTGGTIQTASATWNPPNQNTNWSVSFAPLPPPTPPKPFTGCYLLEASAANEGTVCSSGMVAIMPPPPPPHT